MADTIDNDKDLEANSVPEGVTSAPVTLAATRTSSNIDTHTPSTDNVAPPRSDTSDPTTADKGMDQVNATLATMGAALTALTETVASLLPKDSNPVMKPPWTHFGSKRKGEEDAGY